MLHPDGKTASTELESKMSDRDLENAEDLRLFREFVAGKRSDPTKGRVAYTKLYMRYRQRVYAYCLRTLCDEQEAEDLFQEVFVRVFTRAEQFEEERNFGGWVFTIAHNLCLNKIRDRKQTDPIEEVELFSRPGDDYGDNWPERIKWALEQIPVDYREAFVLREYEGMSYNAIAEILHTTLPAVKSRIYRSKEQLRKLLEPYYHDPA